MIIVLFILYCILASSGLTLFKLGSLNTNHTLSILNFNINYSIKMILGLICYIMSFILWMVIVSKSNLTIAMPLSVAIVNTLVILEACIILNERITLLQGIGIFIVVLGVCIMTVGRK